MTRDEALKLFSAKRLAAMDRVRRDGRLSASIRAVGGELFSRLDFATGDAYPSEEYLVEKLGLSVRTVKRAVKELQACGYFTLVKRGRNNRYRPVFEAAEQVPNWHPSEPQQVPNLPLSEPDRCQKRPEQVPKTSENRCQKGPPTSLVKSLGLLERAPESADAPDDAAAPTFDLGLPGVALRQKLGNDVFKSWLGKVAVVSIGRGELIAGEELVLSVPTKFLADYIQNNFEAAILECWQVEHADLRRLRVVIASAAPAATPIASRRPPSEVADARWLVDVGLGIVQERLFVSASVADLLVVEWLKRCGHQGAGLRKIIAEAAEQDLVGDRFRSVVKQRTRALLHGEQLTIPHPPIVLKRNAS